MKVILENWSDYNNYKEWLQSEHKSFVEDVEKAHWDEKAELHYFNQPSVLYNGIIAPVVSFGIRGVNWYKGGVECIEGILIQRNVSVAY